MKHTHFIFIILLLCFSCNSQPGRTEKLQTDIKATAVSQKNITGFDAATKTIHVIVALCDNKYQGIVPVPAKIGNGQDPNNNLYWGCANGIRSFFKASKVWKLIKTQKTDSIRLERLVFKHVSKNYYLVADAYDGKYIRKATTDFLYSCSRQLKDTLRINNVTIGLNGNAKLLSYIGHDGLMDFRLTESFENTDGQKRDCIILVCISKKYFGYHLKQTNANPLVWTTGLMCPEAYTLHDAISGFVNNESDEDIRSKAALAYAKYQKCGVKAARNLLVTG